MQLHGSVWGTIRECTQIYIEIYPQSTTVQGEDEFISVDYTLTAGAITGSESPYSKFAVKIVMYDDNTFANVPKIRNMIAIAHGEV